MIEKSVSRVLAVQGICALQGIDLSTVDISKYVDDLIGIAESEEDVVWHHKSNGKFLYRLLKYYVGNTKEVDTLIEAFKSDDWKMERVQSVCLAAVRMGIAEILSCPQNPLKVIISEYVAIADMFIENDQAAFVNAILDKVGGVVRSDSSNQSTHDEVPE